jgi:hypothetical protein
MRLNPPNTVIAALGLAALFSITAPAAENKLTVHEWGTFTSVQGGDGKLLEWSPFGAKDLPSFVHDWNRPGFNRAQPSAFVFGKGSIRSLQRMETPVIYFYSDRGLTADVTVRFPGGLITEWFPQAQEVTFGADGKSSTPATSPLQHPSASLTNSVIAWKGVNVLPMKSAGGVILPGDAGTNHYYAARETDSDYVHVASGGTNGGLAEWEKLLFYRGIGSFPTPLKVTVGEDGIVTVANEGGHPLGRLFLIQIRGGLGHWDEMNALAAGGSATWRRLGQSKANPWQTLAAFQTGIGERMEDALVGQGLFPKEAAAMVKTWSDSWFAEEGTRVLHILPGEWTDATLPLALDPKPDALVRVMVGRAEVIPPSTVRELAAARYRVERGDPGAAQTMEEHRLRLGRFFAPANELAGRHLARQNTNQVAAAQK